MSPGSAVPQSRHRPGRALAVLVAAAVAAVVATVGGLALAKRPTPNHAVAGTTQPITAPVPGWTAACFPAGSTLDFGPASAYVGLTRDQAVALAKRSGATLVSVGIAGTCGSATTSSDVFYAHPIAAVFSSPDGVHLMKGSRVLAAHHVSPRWATGWAVGP